jgi:CrcB protein
MLRFFLLAAGGAAGTLARYGVSVWADRAARGVFPAGTMAVNLAGCFLIGAVWALFERSLVSPGQRLFLMTGFLGGFTTFSTFGLETFSLLRDGQYWAALASAAANNLLGLGLVMAGFFCANFIMGRAAA